MDYENLVVQTDLIYNIRNRLIKYKKKFKLMIYVCPITIDELDRKFVSNFCIKHKLHMFKSGDFIARIWYDNKFIHVGSYESIGLDLANPIIDYDDIVQRISNCIMHRCVSKPPLTFWQRLWNWTR